MRILVADDHTLFRDGLISLLTASGFDVIGQVGSGEEAIEATTRLRPDVVLLDISMPGMNGLEALRRIKADVRGVKVVMLTVSDEDDDLLAAMHAGAQGYLLKSLDSKGLVSSLHALERGELIVSRSAASRLIEGLLAMTQDGLPSSREVLTQREIQLLHLVAAGHSNKAIAQELAVSENTVKYHIRQILQKLNVQNRTEAVTAAMRLGLLHES